MGLFRRSKPTYSSTSPEALRPLIRLWVRPRYTLLLEEQGFQSRRGVEDGMVPYVEFSEFLVGLLGIKTPQGENILCKQVIEAWGIEGAQQAAYENEFAHDLRIMETKLPGCVRVLLTNGEAPSLALRSAQIAEATFGEASFAVMATKTEVFVLDSTNAGVEKSMSSLRDHFCTSKDAISAIGLSLNGAEPCQPFEFSPNRVEFGQAQNTAILTHRSAAYQAIATLHANEAWFAGRHQSKILLFSQNGAAVSLTKIFNHCGPGIFPQTDQIVFVDRKTKERVAVNWDDAFKVAGEYFERAPSVIPAWTFESWPPPATLDRLRSLALS